MGTLAIPLRDAGKLMDATPIEPTPAAPELPHQVVVAEPVTVEVRAMPALIIASMPAPTSWRHVVRRNERGDLTEVISVPLTEAAP